MSEFRHAKPLIKPRTGREHHEEVRESTTSDALSSVDLETNKRVLQGVFQNCSDVVFRSLVADEKVISVVVYVDGLVDTKLLDEFVIKPLLSNADLHGTSDSKSIGQVLDQLISVAQTKLFTCMEDVEAAIVKGSAAVLADGRSEILLAELPGFERRSVEEPKTESSIRGPRDGFTETLRTNTTLIRRKIANSRLKIESFTIGDLTHTDVALTYMEGLVVNTVLEDVRERLRGVTLDSVMESAYIEEFIQDTPLSPFPQIQNTERADTVAAALLEGKVAILVDGTPFVLILPVTFWNGLQSADDHYQRWDFVITRKLIRYIMIFISLAFPSIYVALTTFNPEMVPGSLMQSIATARENSPFPTVIETLVMEFVFEGLQEAGIRMPSQLGGIVSIVGALVIGEAAVRADLISAPIIVVVALTGIASYIVPRYSFGVPFRVLRFGLIVISGAFGVYGLAIGLIAILIHLVTLESFGVPYFAPVAPLVFRQLRDVVVRTPRWGRRSFSPKHRR